MISIYTSLDYFKPNEVIIDNESFFKNISISELTDEFLEIMKKIDKADLINTKTGKIETPYGVANIWDLSTGCKTAMNTLYVYKYHNFPALRAINVTECGINALEEIFDLVDSNNIDIKLVLEHDDNTVKCKERNYIINGKDSITNLAFIGAFR